MKRYQTYKPSGIEWLGEIPEDWEVRRLKDISIVATGSRNTEDKLDDGKYPFFVRSQTVEYIDTYSFNGEAILTAGDGVGVAKVFHHYIGKFETHQRVYRISNFPKCNGRFLFYFLMENVYKEVLKFNVKSTVDSLRMPMFLQFPVLLPTKSAQTAIANYLDTKTAAIDRKIELLTTKANKYKALRRSLINETVCRGLPASEGFTPSEALIKMKDSGIEWIGMIPEHWEEYRMKDLGFLYSGLSGKAGDDFNQDENENNCDFIPFTNIFNNETINPEIMGKVVVFENEKQNKVKKNDLFFLMSSEDYDGLGKSSLLAVDLINTYLNSFCKGFRITRKKVLPAFLNYQLQSDTFRKIMQIEGKGFTRLNLKMEKVNDFTVYIPNTIEEQAAIVKYLNEKNTHIDTILTNISNQINKLTQLRKTLINDVVTGKIKVTD